MLTSLAEIHTLSGGKARCARDDCLLCELAFLFMMLRDAKGANCQATNLLRAFAKSGKGEIHGNPMETTSKIHC
jgi:PAB-dependent poly(A)-specific ribonuclease subunit 2